MAAAAAAADAAAAAAAAAAGKSPEMVESCYASCRPACESSCIDDEYALFTVQEIICGKVSEY